MPTGLPALRCAALLLLLLAVEPLTMVCAQSSHSLSVQAKPFIVAHRGSSVNAPENTLTAYRRAIDEGAHAIEIDLRLTRDGHLVSLHDATVNRTTDGTGEVASMSLSEVKSLDAGSWFHPRFREERVPTFQEILSLAGDTVDVLLDLKDQHGAYEQAVVDVVLTTPHPGRIIFGVRSVRAARFFRQHVPGARLVGLIPNPEDLDEFADADVPVIRLWPRWLASPEILERLRSRNLQLLISAGKGTAEEVKAVVGARPDWLFVDDPAQLRTTLREVPLPLD